MSFRLIRLLPVVALATCVASAALAQPTAEDKKRAAQTFRQAEAAFGRGEFEAAAAAFEQAGRFAPHPKTFLNAAEAWEAAGQPARAAEACARVLSMEGATGSLREEAKARLASLQPKVLRLEIIGPPGFRVRVDGSDPAAVPHDRYLEPGPHRIEVNDPAAPEARVVSVEGGAGEVRHVDLTPKVNRPIDGSLGDDRAPVEERPLVPIGTWVCVGIAGGAAVVVGLLGGLTLKAQGDFEEQPTQDNADTFNAYRLGTNISIGVGGAALLAGAIVWIVDATTAPDRVALTPLVGPSSASLELHATW